MARCSFLVSTLLLSMTAILAVDTLAQKAPAPERKKILTVKPDYPPLLRHQQIGGLVRLLATVLPDGTVAKVEIRGGNPILAESAVAAVMKWKYAPSASQTTEDISLSFSPH
jgi:TonB family protein